jgi:hypothetical protein
MDTKCPQCGSGNTGPSFIFDYDRDDADRVIARNPFFVCAGCEHTWQVETVMVVAQPFDPEDDEAVNAFVEAVNRRDSRLDECDFTGANLTRAKASHHTTWPEGFDPVAAGVTFG